MSRFKRKSFPNERNGLSRFKRNQFIDGAEYAYIDLAKKLQENYIAHQKDTDIISEEEQDDVKYARENQYDEAIFIEDANTVIMHDIKSFYTNRCLVSDVYYQ